MSEDQDRYDDDYAPCGRQLDEVFSCDAKDCCMYWQEPDQDMEDRAAYFENLD